MKVYEIWLNGKIGYVIAKSKKQVKEFFGKSIKNDVFLRKDMQPHESFFDISSI